MIKKLLSKYDVLPVQAKASVWFLFCSIMQKGISVITTPIFTRLLSTSEYGKFNVFLSWQGIVAAIVVLTLPFGVVEQGLIKFPDERKQFTSANLGLITTLTVIWLGIYCVSSSFWNKAMLLSSSQVLALLAMTFLSSVCNFWLINQRVDYKYQKAVIMTIAVSIVKPVVGIYLVTHFDDKVSARIIGLAAVEFFAYLPLYINMMMKGKMFFSKRIWSYSLRFNIPLIPHYLSQRVLNSSDRIMIEAMCNEGDAGLYSLAYSLSMLMSIVNSALQSALNPWIYQKLKDNKGSELKKVVYPTLLLVAFINLILISFAPEAVRIFAPSSYYDAIWVIPPVAMSVFFMFMYGFFANIEFYFEKTKLMSLATVIGAFINVVLNYIFIQKYGYIAAGYTTLACYIIYAVCHYLFAMKICREQMHNTDIFNVWIISGISIGFMALGFLLCFAYKHIVLRYAIIVVLMITAIIYRKQIFDLLKFRKQNH